jgi:hypothetical protein
MKVYELWIQAGKNDWQLELIGSYEEVEQRLRYITLNHPDYSYKTILRGEK